MPGWPVVHILVIRGPGGGIWLPAQLSVRGQSCTQRTSALKTVVGFLCEERAHELECAGLDTRSPDQRRHAAVLIDASRPYPGLPLAAWLATVAGETSSRRPAGA